MSQITITLKEAVDSVIDEMPLGKRLAVRMFMLRPKYRKEIYQAVEDKIIELDAEEGLGLAPVFEAPGFSATTAFRIDIDKLERLLELIAKYIPIFISLFSARMAAEAAALLLCVTLTSGTASGQGFVCRDGQCFQVDAAPAQAVAPVRAITEAPRVVAQRAVATTKAVVTQRATVRTERRGLLQRLRSRVRGFGSRLFGR